MQRWYLTPPASESFDVAASGNTSSYLSEARTAVVNLKINNIRVIGRILKTMRRIADEIGDVEDVAASHWVPSTALLTACQYHAVENAPPFEYIKSFNQHSHLFDDKNGIKRDPKELDWDLLLNKLGMHYIDEYEELIHQFLQSGVLETDRLKKRFESYKREGANSEAHEKLRDFFTACWWDAKRSEADLLIMAADLFPFTNVFGADVITDLVSVVEKKLGDVDLARKFLDSWLLSIETRPEYQQMNEVPFDMSLREYHPDVIRKMNEMRDKQHPPLTVIETANRIIDNSGWGERGRYSLRNSSIQQYEDALKQITGDQLRRFLSIHLEWAKNAPYDENFKIGVNNFIAACSKARLAEPSSRLSAIILRTFEANGLAAKLEAAAN